MNWKTTTHLCPKSPKFSFFTNSIRHKSPLPREVLIPLPRRGRTAERWGGFPAPLWGGIDFHNIFNVDENLGWGCRDIIICHPAIAGRPENAPAVSRVVPKTITTIVRTTRGAFRRRIAPAAIHPGGPKTYDFLTKHWQKLYPFCFIFEITVFLPW